MNDDKQKEAATPALTGPAHGPQGVDKAPGEEEAEDTLQFEQLTQKGKKNDGDPEIESDQPASQAELPESQTDK